MLRNVLIFHLGALGDFVLTWPLALALARLHPQSRVFYVTHGQKGKLAERALRIDSTDIEGGWHTLFSAGAVLPDPAQKLTGSAHTIVSFLSDGQDAWAQNARRLAPQAALLALRPATLAAPPVGEHATAFLHRQLRPSPAIAGAFEQIQRSINDRGIGGRGRPDGTILIHPGSGSASKCWPIERFVDLAARLRQDGRVVRLVIGETELDRWDRSILDSLGGAERPADLVGLYDAIRSASLFIGNDSGPAHLAGALDVPTIVLYGPTSPLIWKPQGPKVTAVEAAGGLEAISVDRVMEAVRENEK
jgi:ADP-heptose:LPS heptosyltransferase